MLLKQQNESADIDTPSDDVSAVVVDQPQSSDVAPPPGRGNVELEFADDDDEYEGHPRPYYGSNKEMISKSKRVMAEPKIGRVEVEQIVDDNVGPEPLSKMRTLVDRCQ